MLGQEWGLGDAKGRNVEAAPAWPPNLLYLSSLWGRGDPQAGLMGTHPLQVLSCPFPGPPRALRYSPEGAGFRVRLDHRAQLCPLLTEETREHFPLCEMRLWGSYLKGIG